MAFEPFDFGKVLQTAETIKGLRQSATESRLRQQYLGERQKQEGQLFDQAQLDRNTLMLAQGTDAVINAPPGEAVPIAARVARQLKEAGVLGFDEASMGNWTDENVRAFAKQIRPPDEFLPKQELGKPIAVAGPDGQPIYVPESQAYGYSPAETGLSDAEKLNRQQQFAQQETQQQQQFTAEQNRLNRDAAAANLATTQTHQMAREESRRTELPPQVRANAQGKLQSITAIRGQLEKVKAAFHEAQKGRLDSTGPIAGRFPTPSGQKFDQAVALLSPLMRQLTRTPGEGQMSDFESKLVQMTLPSRTSFETATDASFQQIEDMVDLVEQGYTGLLGGGQSSAPQVGWSIEPVSSGAAPLSGTSALPGHSINLQTGEPLAPRNGQQVPIQDRQAAGQQVTEGTVIVNPQTGERMTLQGGQWVPVGNAHSAGPQTIEWADLPP